MYSELDKCQKFHDEYVETGCDKSSKEFESLMKSLMDTNRKYLKSIMKTNNRLDVDDVLMLSMQKVCEGIEMYTGLCPIVLWTFKISRHCFLDSVKVEKKRNLISLDSEMIYGCTESSYIIEEYNEDIIGRIAKVKNYDMFKDFSNGFRIKELSDKYGMSEGCIKSRLFRYKKEAKKCLCDERIS